MSGFYTQLTEHVAAFAVVYGIFLSMGEAGPGDCLGLLASKTWPTAARGQMCEFPRTLSLSLYRAGECPTLIPAPCTDGLAAAIGKLGAYCDKYFRYLTVAP